MRLTDALYRFKRALPGGHLWRGKYRLYKKVTPEHLHKLKLQFELEEKNMFFLRHPYLTIEQSNVHGKHEGSTENKIANKVWKDHKYLGDRFGFLKVTDSWE